MAVIVSNKTFPNACIGCDYQDCDFYDTAWNRAGESHINYTNSRAVNCPLKSIDGLIGGIQEELPKSYFFGNHSHTYLDEEDVIQFIKEYCGVEE